MTTTKPYFSLLLIFIFFAACEQAPTHDRSRPNIIYVLADDLGYNELGVYGQKYIETPNIDQLAKNGLRFSRHYSGSPVCAPSRCVLMTGKHTGHAHIRGNDEWASRGEVWNFAKAVEDPNLEGQRPIPNGTETVGSMLQKVGYKTAIVGKWGLGAPLTEGIPTKKGFDYFFGYNCQRQAHTLYPKHLWENEEKVWLDNKLVPPRQKLAEGADPMQDSSYADYELKEYAPELMLDRALGFMDKNKEEPFFLYFASPLPHVPLQAPRKWVDHYRKKFGDEEPYIGDKGYFPCRYPKATYAAMISYLDEQVGAMVQKLKDIGQYENTLIIFSSDNGPTYVGGADTPFFESASPFSTEYGRAKGFVHEGGIRVPMIASWPGVISPNTQSNHPSSFYDVMPTLGEITGAPVPQDIDGQSFLPSLKGANQAAPEFLYWEFPAYKGQQALIMGKWKGIRKDMFDGNLRLELYDLETDSTEQIDVAHLHLDVVAQMEQILKQEHVPAEIERFKWEVFGEK
ncbi:MAG: arylsulfatase [Bacteroidia bacterium]|nr:arylsulfatase [Bacteroidia bacterium]